MPNARAPVGLLVLVPKRRDASFYVVTSTHGRSPADAARFERGLDARRHPYFIGRMVKNGHGRSWRTGLPIWLPLLGACAAAGAAPPGYQGIVELDERHLGFELPGRLRAVPVVRGQLIESGTILAVLDDGLERPVRAARAAELDAARAQLALLRAGARSEDVRGGAAQVRAAEANRAKIEHNLARARTLLADGAFTQADVDNLAEDARGAREQVAVLEERLRLLRAGSRPEEVTAAEARVAAANAALEAEDERLRRFTLRADAPAAILDLHLEPGEIASGGLPVVTIADTAHPFVDVFVPQPELGAIQLAGPACVRVDSEATPWPGRVESIARHTEFTPRFLFSDRERPHLVVRVRIRIDDPERRLHAGVPAFVTWKCPS